MKIETPWTKNKRIKAERRAEMLAKQALEVAVWDKKQRIQKLWKALAGQEITIEDVRKG